MFVAPGPVCLAILIFELLEFYVGTMALLEPLAVGVVFLFVPLMIVVELFVVVFLVFKKRDKVFLMPVLPGNSSARCGLPR